MRRRTFLLATAVAALPSLAPAGDPAKLNVTLATTLAADPHEVWSAIGDFQDMSWHPAVHATTGSGGNAANATRRLVLGGADGPTIDEALDSHSDDAMTYAYRITEVAPEVLPVTDYASQLAVTPRDGGGALVEWRGAFLRGHPDTEPPDALDDDAAIAAVTGVYQAGLDALEARFGAPGS
jgi:hypothetical protein